MIAAGHDYPLKGTRVVDLSRVLAGPFAGRMLADLGADVVKLEPPEGDVTRLFGRQVAGIGGFYHQQNAGKRSVCLDLRVEQAREVLLRLLATADIAVENFRPGVLDGYGVGWQDLHRANERLVLLSISGFGQHGPERDRAAYAEIVHAETGLLDRHAVLHSAPVTTLGISAADTFAGLHGLVATLAAYHMVRSGGEGQHIDISMVDAMVSSDDYAHYGLDGGAPFDAGARIFETPHGPLVLAGDDKWWWHQLSRSAGLVDPTPEGADLRTKIACRRRAVEEYIQSFSDRSALLATLDEANLVWGVVRDHQTVYDSQETIVGRGVVTEVDNRTGGYRRITQSPYRFSGARAGVRGPAAYRGEHNYAVLGDWLEMSADEVDELHRSGVLLSERVSEDSKGGPPS